MWTPALRASQLGARPLALMLAGEPLVFFRDAKGAPAALIDRCPHRGARLSLGRITPEGCLACPFHGWEFDAAGHNVHVPFDPGARRERLGATPVPVRQIGDLLWVYTAPGTTAPNASGEPNVPDALQGDRDRRTYLERTWACHWTRAMENMLDSPHLPFVHRTTIGRPLLRRMKRDSRMELAWEPAPWGGRQTMWLDGEGGLAWLEFHRPNMMALHIPIPGRRFRVHALVIPVDDATTRLMVVGSRDFARWRALDPFFNRSNGVIADQDKAVVESTWPREVPPATQERNVATDGVTLRFRKYYFETLRDSDAP